MHILFKPIALLALLALMIVPTALAGATEPADAADDWTVLIYMCGSDLESKDGMASYNLSEIAKATPVTPEMLNMFGSLYITEVDSANYAQGKVNVLIETGGCGQWHARDVGLDIAADRLQRYEYDPLKQKGFALLEDAPLASMAAPQTLADFIRWGVATRPAQKYALILWDHGGGSRTGLFVDELFDGDVMGLDELGQALAAGGAHFDTLIIDACMMANLETAQAVAPYADYMVSSEEIAAGYGGAYRSWLTMLYMRPENDGLQFARLVCDTMLQKYANMGHEQACDMLTYSVIDLSEVDALAAAFDALMENMGRLYEESPMVFNVMSTVMKRAEHYGMGGENMIDLGSVLCQGQALLALDAEVRNDMIEAISRAVVYTVKGPARAAAFGVSFCYDLNMTPAHLDIYARNCRSAPYLALLDAVNEDWSAPEWVYERTRRLRPLDGEAGYRLKLSVFEEKGQPRLLLTSSRARKRDVDYVLYYLDAQTGQFCRLGRDACNLLEFTPERQVYGMDTVGSWPAVEGVLCDIEKVSENDEYVIYNIPIQMGETVYNLRASYLYDTTLLSQALKLTQNQQAEDGTVELSVEKGNAPDYSGHYELYGLWEGYDSDSDMPNRNIVSFSSVQGREFKLLYPVYVKDGGEKRYAFSEPMTMLRGMEIGNKPLAEGTYYMAFVVTDVFGKEFATDPVRVHWDGVRFQTE